MIFVLYIQTVGCDWQRSPAIVVACKAVFCCLCIYICMQVFFFTPNLWKMWMWGWSGWVFRSRVISMGFNAAVLTCNSSHELFATFYSSIVTEFLAYNFRISWYMHIMKGLHIISLYFQNYGRSLTHSACMVSCAQVHFIHALYRSLFFQLFIYFW